MIAAAAALFTPLLAAAPAQAQTSGVPVMVSYHSRGMCLDTRASDKVVLLWTCHGGGNQAFRFQTGNYGLIALGNGDCLQGGGNLKAASGSMVAAGGGNLVGNDGASIVMGGAGKLIGNDGSTMVAAGGGNMVAAGGGNLVPSNFQFFSGSTAGMIPRQ